ncbi:hypothetical protein EASAB2608_06234 [Streptomyces sp. EAS-AB2608]|uniref:hypothetical protein n=1 Tax=Streptomyces sp. EAS-AB2608 TaxID=2779671 RepID=UPI001BF161F7|nr:hypothetical protein [Streptomyces sp. EAS-AB2608]BCM70900.1 hypothetical protein EASAB2608_06234 [Streptomyces sp. EAS-AB2608]
MTQLYRVRPNPGSAVYPWRWECLHAYLVGVATRPVRCTAHGLGRTAADAEKHAARHADTHTRETR